MQKKEFDTLLFIDTNILLDFYRVQGGGVGLELLELIEKHSDILITGSQIEMEYKKNRQGVILTSLNSYKMPDTSAVRPPAFLVDSKQNKALETSVSSFKTNYTKLRKRIEGVIANPSRNDPVYKTLQRIFKKPSPYNLDRTDDVRFEIRELAKKRFILGYPPRKNADTSIGDAINWEWIVYVASKYKKNVVIVTRDSDYGHLNYINDWLRQEFKQRVSNKKDVFLTDRLSVAFKKVSIPVRNTIVTEEQKMVERLTTETQHTGIASLLTPAMLKKLAEQDD